MDRIYVIGHVNPDTDSIAAAMGYAWLLRERDGVDAQAARAGSLNPQTTWVLRTLGLESPLLLNDASPRFEAIVRRLDTTTPDRPLRYAWAIANRTWGVAPVVNEDGTPYGLVNGTSLFSFFSHKVGNHPRYQEMKLAEILETPCKEACDQNVLRFQSNGRIRDSLSRILRQEGDDFLVVNEKGDYVGVCRQRDVLNPPRLKVILVDHNEPSQALGSLEEAELLEIIDHHRLGNASTHVPIRFTVDIVGSTSTLISERIEEAGFSASPAMAALLLAGCFSDTLTLTSPTTTERDHLAVERLGRWASVKGSPLEDQNLLAYGEQVLHAGSGLAARDPQEVVNSDLKLYEVAGFSFAIAQVEVTDLLQLDEHRQELFSALKDLRDRNGLDFAILMVTDVVRGSSRLLLTNEPPELHDLPYPLQTDGSRLAEGIVSRKKQLLPVVLGLLES
ncbi:MAG: DHHA2 domain-containing protein [Anaerolineaceae bacterium]